MDRYNESSPIYSFHYSFCQCLHDTPGSHHAIIIPRHLDGSHIVAQKTTLSQVVTLTSMSFFVESDVRRRSRPTPTPHPTPAPTPTPGPTSTPTPTPGQISLAWNLDSDQTVVGYNLYYTTNPKALTQALTPPIPGTVDKISGMSITTTTLTGFSSGVVFYFGLTAYNAKGIESPLSNVSSTTVP
jgi:hypothetical protein